ncbi:MAG: IS200/IS605 family transposase [Turneriella sp.]|nr:IS200/IS605 family transposase [Turneriella sp.]
MPKGHSYYNLYFHIVWHTKNNYPYLTEDVLKYIDKLSRRICRQQSCEVLELNGTEDHLHLLIRCSKWISIPDLMWAIKGKSSYEISRQEGCNLFWQSGYALFSVSEKDIPNVRKYILNQKHHHDDWPRSITRGKE